MSDPILPLYEAMTAAASEMLAVQSRYDAAKAALLASMPEHVEFATTPDHPPLIKGGGTEVIAVPTPHVGHPCSAGVAARARPSSSPAAAPARRRGRRSRGSCTGAASPSAPGARGRGRPAWSPACAVGSRA